jgi:hypothetical protein
VAVALALGACGGADVGEECEVGGSEDECVSGAVCTNDSEGLRCREICVVKEDCPADFDCNGVTSTSIKSCQPT